MQRYKLNTRFLIILVVLFGVVLGGSYGLWAFQVYKSAPGIKAEAEKAVTEERYEEANELWRRYLSFRPGDVDAQIKYAESQLAFAESGRANSDQLIVALSETERILRINPIPRDRSDWSEEMVEAAPKLDALRARTAETKVRFALWKDAIDHLDYLIGVRQSDDPKHHVLFLRSLVGSQLYDGEEGAIAVGFKLVGYDEIDQQFDDSKAVTPHETDAYVLLARTLRRHRKDDQLADRVMNQLVAVNPKSHEAFLQRSLYWEQREELDLAQQDWQRAYDLNQEELGILLTGTYLAMKQENTEFALELAEKALELHPDDYRTYVEVARARGISGEREAALEVVDKGLRTVRSGLAMFHLLMFKCDLLLQENRLEDATEAIDMLAQIAPASEIPRYFQARVMLAERKWIDAIKLLEQARPGLTRPELMAQFPMILPTADRYRGFAYQQLGQFDLARQAFRESLKLEPNQPEVARLLQSLERMGGSRIVKASTSTENLSLVDQVKEMQSRPAAQQQWQQIEQSIERDIEERGFDEPMAKLYWSEYRFRRGQTEEAYKLLQEAVRMDPPQNVYLGAIRLAHLLPEAGARVAHRLIDAAVEKFGDNASFRLERGRLWALEKEDGLVERLWSLNEGTEGWDDHQRTHFLKELAKFFRETGHPDQADRALKLASELSPQDLDALMEMFAIARMRHDNAAMLEVQKQIEEVVGSKEDDDWQFTEAARLVTLYASGLRDPDLLEKATKLTEAISRRRAEWDELHRLRGDIFTLRGRIRDATDAYDRALEFGPPNPVAIRQHVQLLLAQERFLDARRVVNHLPEETRLAVLETLYPEVLLRSADPRNRSEVARALELAKQVVDEDSENPTKHLWYADQLLRNGRLEEAEAPVRKALSLNPEDMQTWLSLVRYLAGSKRPEDAEQVLREARLALPEHELPLLLAQGYALLGKWWQAEREYLIALRAAPDDLKRVRMLADFYLGRFYHPERQDRYAKAVPYVNRLLQQEVSDNADLETVQWARRKAAEIFASTGDYQNTLKAEKLLQANAVDGQLPLEDQLQLATILAGRPEPGARRRAIQLLESAQANRSLDQESALLLAQLYWKTGRHDDARKQIFDVVARHGDTPNVWQMFVAMHLAQGYYKDAAQYFQEKLESTLPKPVTLAALDAETVRTLALGVQVWNKQGQTDKAVATLYGAIPRQQDLRDEDVPKLLEIGALLVLIGEKEKAAPVYELFARKRPRQGLVYVKFLGAYQDVEKAFQYLKKYEEGTAPADMFPVLQTALAIVNARRDEVGDSKDAIIESWLDKGLRENPDSTDLLGLKADLLEMQKKYAEAQAVYERMLATRGFTGYMRTRVLNNLAYLLALQNIDTDRALNLIEEAREIAGPSDDILDTRGVIHTAMGNYNPAISDLELAVTEDPDAAKWFHLARAYWLAGRRKESVDAWQRAEDLDIGPEKLNRMEHETLQRFIKEIAQEQTRFGGAPQT